MVLIDVSVNQSLTDAMTDIIKKFGHLDIASLASTLGGLLFTPSVIVNSLISTQNNSRFYSGAVLNILCRAPEFILKGYILEVDKGIVLSNLECALAGGYITPEKLGVIEGALHRLIPLKSGFVEGNANIRSCEMALYDARRLEMAFAHNLTLVTSEPEDFTSDPNELSHIFKYEYSDVAVGESIDVDMPDRQHIAKVWVFKPDALATLLIHFNRHDQIQTASRKVILSLSDFKTNSGIDGSQTCVWLYLNGDILSGQSRQVGTIDGMLRAIESALASIIDLSCCDVHHRSSDTTTERDSIRIRIRLNVPKKLHDKMKFPNSCFEAVDESQDLMLSTAKAYIKVINTLLNELGY